MTEPGPAVRGYELREQIGTGAAGTAYRAYQPAVGREVAIKVIGSDLANDPAFIRRFQAEAQVIASSSIRTSSRCTTTGVSRTRPIWSCV